MSEKLLKRFLLSTHQPVMGAGVFIAPGAVVLGGVTLGAESSVWYQAVVRADINHIVIGAQSNLQDAVIVHVSDDHPCVVGERVTVGHRAILHACRIGDEVLVGMGAIVLDGAVIGPRCVLGAGALVTKGTRAPEGSLLVGSPARVVRALTLEEQQANGRLALKYVEVSRRYLELDRAK